MAESQRLPAQAKLIESIGKYLDRHLLAEVLRFSVDHPENAEAKEAYETAIRALTDTGDTQPLDEKVVKARSRSEPLFSKFFLVEGTDFSPRFIDREFADAVDLNSAQCKFCLSEVGASSLDHIDALYVLSETLVEARRYTDAAAVLKVYNALVANLTVELSSARDDLATKAEDTEAKGVKETLKELNRVERQLTTLAQRQPRNFWGQYLCEVLSNQPKARDCGQLLDRIIHLVDVDDGSTTERDALAKLWILHWGLFYWFKCSSDSLAFLELLYPQDRAERSKNQIFVKLIQYVAPHLLRYVAVAAILNRKRRKSLRIVAKLLDSEADHYSDPITQFVVRLCVRSDFAGAAALLPECQRLLDQDFFCHESRDEFISNARKLFFEDQLRIRNSIKIATAAKELGLPVDQAELWLVELIREAKIDATIDSVGGRVRVQSVATQKSVWQHVMDQLSAATHYSVI